MTITCTEADLENSERGSRDTCQLYRYYYLTENSFKKIQNFIEKRGPRSPWNTPKFSHELNPPQATFFSRTVLQADSLWPCLTQNACTPAPLYIAALPRLFSPP